MPSSVSAAERAVPDRHLQQHREADLRQADDRDPRRRPGGKRLRQEELADRRADADAQQQCRPSADRATSGCVVGKTNSAAKQQARATAEKWATIARGSISRTWCRPISAIALVNELRSPRPRRSAADCLADSVRRC